MAAMSGSALTVVAIGGHSLLDPEREPTVANQFAVTADAVVPIADLIERGDRLVLTHGNGPQVGFLQLRSELARKELPEVPLDSLVADTQGAMGYMIERALRGELRRRGLTHEVVTVVTEVEVAPDDPAFARPEKPIGRFYTQDQAELLAREHHWQLVEDPRRGFRRVVPSPAPARIVQLPTIEKLAELDVTVICCGGGGIPVSRDESGRIRGHEAVIDKDLVSTLLAVHLGASRLVITTSVDGVYEGWFSDEPRRHAELSVAEVTAMAQRGEFAPGSMAPKMQAVVSYLDAIDGEALICLPRDLVAAVDGHAGTRIRRGE